MNASDNTTDQVKMQIPVHNLKLKGLLTQDRYSDLVLQDEIEGLTIQHLSYEGPDRHAISLSKDHGTFYLVLSGEGFFITNGHEQAVDTASIVVPPTDAKTVTVQVKADQTLDILAFTKQYSRADIEALQQQDYPADQLYYRRYVDCEPYTEKIKSPNTISRTILPAGIIPRVALGTVEAMGPDKVGEHSHPMLEQLFLGLDDNDITVHADGSSAYMSAFSLLHIPLGSTHSVEVADKCKMHYVWMDFFLTKDGEEWLDTHKPINKSNTDDTA